VRDAFPSVCAYDDQARALGRRGVDDLLVRRADAHDAPGFEAVADELLHRARELAFDGGVPRIRKLRAGHRHRLDVQHDELGVERPRERLRALERAERAEREIRGDEDALAKTSS
jgi:hypothetical protein